MNGVGVEEAQRVSLEDAEFLVVRVPAKLHREDVDRLREQIRSCLGTDVPVLVLEGGAELDVVRSGGWVYTGERLPEPGTHCEVATAYHDGERRVHLALFDTKPDHHVLGDWRYEGDPTWRPGPYAWRPAPAPPPLKAERGGRTVTLQVVTPPGSAEGDWTILGLPYVIEESA